MIKIIDTNNETTSKLQRLKSLGVECIIRYISTNTATEKAVKPVEARAIADAGLKLGLVFEVWGGVDNFAHDDIHAGNGTIHGNFARQWAAHVGAPINTILWFAIDTDCTADDYQKRVRPYFLAAKTALQGDYRIGVYGCGFVCNQALGERLVDATWLTQSMGFNGSRAFRDSRRWSLLQGPETTLEGLSIDTNEAAGDDHGAFVPFEAAVPVLVPSRVTQPQPPALPQLDWMRIEREIARFSQAAAGFAEIADRIGHVPTAGLSPQVVQAEQSIDRLGRIAGTLSRYAAILAGQAPAPDAKSLQLSPIDGLLGGKALVGLKTPLAIGGYALMWILQALGALGTATGNEATTTGAVLTALVSAVGVMGVTSKFDRAFQALALISGRLQRLTA